MTYPTGGSFKISENALSTKRITIEDGNLMATGSLHAGNGFTGTGSYTNFTIVDGIITSAS